MIRFAFPIFRQLRPADGSGQGSPRARLVLPKDDSIVYAVGDVHGCRDLLLGIEALIYADAKRFGARPKRIIMLGDLIDRGLQSAEVVDHLIGPAPEGFSRYVLAGNHEAAMLAFLCDPAFEDQWLAIGGFETLASYGIFENQRATGRSARFRLATAAWGGVPEEHIAFLRERPITVAWGRYLFVHAGIRPHVPLDAQSDRDLLEIRQPFTASAADHGSIVVHGHTPEHEPIHYGNRIALDLAPYATGRIAAARFDGDSVDFLVYSKTLGRRGGARSTKDPVSGT